MNEVSIKLAIVPIPLQESSKIVMVWPNSALISALRDQGDASPTVSIGMCSRNCQVVGYRNQLLSRNSGE